MVPPTSSIDDTAGSARLPRLFGPRRRRRGGSRRRHAGAHGGGRLHPVRAGARDSRRARHAPPLRRAHLRHVRLPRRVQPQLHFTDVHAAPGTARSRRRLGRQRLPRHRPGADHRDDRELSQRAHLERDAQKPVYARAVSSARASPAAGSRRRRSEPLRAVAVGSRRSRWSCALPAAAGACAQRRRTSTSCASGRWAAKARWSPSWSREFERTHPGIRVQVQQMPWTAAHEKLLTAFAGDATPDICQLGNTWIPEFVALGALEPLDAVARGVRGRSQRGLLRRHLGHQRRRRRGCTACRGTSTRGCSSTGSDLLAQRRLSPSPPRRWAEWMRRDAPRIKARAGPDHYAILLPMNEFEPLLALALQQDDPLLRDGGRYGNFRSPGFRARARRSTSDMFREGLAPPRQHIADRPTCGTSSAAASSRSTSPGRGTSASSGAGCRRSCRARWCTAPLPGPDGAGRLDRRRLEPRRVRALAAQGRGLEADRVPVATRTCSCASTR